MKMNILASDSKLGIIPVTFKPDILGDGHGEMANGQISNRIQIDSNPGAPSRYLHFGLIKPKSFIAKKARPVLPSWNRVLPGDDNLSEEILLSTKEADPNEN